MAAYISALRAELLNALIVFKLCVRSALFLLEMILKHLLIGSIVYIIVELSF